jgi:hypothetical protein
MRFFYPLGLLQLPRWFTWNSLMTVAICLVSLIG